MDVSGKAGDGVRANASSAPEHVVTAVSFANLTRESLVYALGALTGKAVGLVMLPLLTRLLPPESFGRLDLLATIGSTATAALLLGVDVATIRLATDPSTTTGRRRLLFGAWLVVGSVLTIPAASVLAVLSSRLSEFVIGDQSIGAGLVLVGPIVVAGTYHHIALTLLRSQGRALAYAAASAGALVLNAMLSIVLLLTWRRDATAILAAWALALTIGALVGFSLAGLRSVARPTIESVRQVVRFGLPIAPAVVATSFAELANRGILLGQAGVEQVAYLSVALRYASVAGLLVVGFQLAWLPRSFALGTSPAAVARIALDGRRIALAVSGLVVTIAFVAPTLVVALSGDAYADAVAAVGPALAVQLAHTLFIVSSMPSSMGLTMGNIGLAGTSGVAVSLIANTLLAGRLGAPATAASMALGHGVAALVLVVLGRSVLPVPFDWRRILAVTLVGAAIAVWLTTVGAHAGVPVRAAVLAMFGVLVAIEGTARDAIRSFRGRDR